MHDKIRKCHFWVCTEGRQRKTVVLTRQRGEVQIVRRPWAWCVQRRGRMLQRTSALQRKNYSFLLSTFGNVRVCLHSGFLAVWVTTVKQITLLSLKWSKIRMGSLKQKLFIDYSQWTNWRDTSFSIGMPRGKCPLFSLAGKDWLGWKWPDGIPQSILRGLGNMKRCRSQMELPVDLTKSTVLHYHHYCLALYKGWRCKNKQKDWCKHFFHYSD